MTDEELSAVREFAGDLLVRAFRGEVDLASGLAEIRDLTPEELFEEAELPDDLDEDLDPLDDGELGGEGELKTPSEQVQEAEPTFELDPEIDVDLSAALETALGR